MNETKPWEGWSILELMGHRRLGGRVSEVEIAGCKMLRIDVPKAMAGDEIAATQFYSASSVYCLTPTTEEIARGVATNSQPAPVQRWELPEAKGLSRGGSSDDRMKFASEDDSDLERDADDDGFDQEAGE